MLNDEYALDNINPFVIDGPGGTRKPYGFSPGVPDKDQVQCDNYGCSLPSDKPQLEKQSYVEKKASKSPWEPMDKTPLCSWGINAQTNGSLDAPSCRSPENPVTCNMQRPLEPTQEFLPDLYTLIPYRDPLPKQLQQPERTHWSTILLVLLFAVIVGLIVSKY
jgi:hypothetical protein